MNSVVSFAMLTLTPGGSSCCSRGSSALSACASVSGLAVACLIRPSEIAARPLKRTMLRSSSGATATRPTSRMRTG